jgi:hypothetical protein
MSEIDKSTGEMAGVSPDPYMIAQINSMAVKIVSPFIAKSDIRYYLNGINLRPLEAGGVMVSASDGHRLIVVRDPTGYVDHEITVTVHKDGLKHAAADGQFVVMSDGAAWFQNAVATETFIQPGNSVIDGRYPRFEAVLVMAGFEEGIRGPVNPEFLRAALAIDTGSRPPSIRFWTKNDDLTPLIFMCDQVAGMEVVGAIMKMREVSDRLPVWIPRPAPFELTSESSLEPESRETKAKADKPLNTVGG